MSAYGATLTHTSRQGNYRDARMAHAMHVTHAYEINQLINAWRDDWGTDAPADEINALLPTGWRWLSSGLYRCAYLSPKGTVYKVNRDVRDGRSMRGRCWAEMEAIQRKAPIMPEGYAIPEATLYHVPGNSADGTRSDYVMAMALVDTSTPFTDCYGECEESGCEFNEGNARVGKHCSSVALEPLHEVMSDVHSGNAFPDALGIVWVVDIAM